MKTITLSDERYDLLVEALDSFQDCGPAGEGWSSKELDGLRNDVAVASATAPDLVEARLIVRELLEFSFPAVGGGSASDYLNQKHGVAKAAALDWLKNTGGMT